MTDPVKPLSDDALRRIETRLKTWTSGGQYPASWDEVNSLCATVRTLRTVHVCGAVAGGSGVGGCGREVTTLEDFRCADCLAWFHRDCINEHFKLDAYVKKLRELREQGAIDDWKKSLADKEAENTALRDQLALAKQESDAFKELTEGEITRLREQLAEVTQRARHIETCKDCQACWEGSQP